MDNFENNAPLQQEEAFPIRELIFRCLAKWPWFVASLGICLLLGLYKIIKTEPVYHTSAEVQIKSDSKGRSISDQNDFSNMGMFTMRSNVNNELRAFQSPDLMSEVVERLNLDVNYYVIGRKRQYAYYGTDLPVVAKFIEPSQSGTSFVVQFQTDSTTVRLKDFTSGSEKLKAGAVEGSYGDTLSTPVGEVVILPNPTYMGSPSHGYEVVVRKGSVRGATGSYLSRLQVGLSDKQADVISLGIDDVSTQRGQDVLSTLISVYNKKWVQDKNQLANATSDFINDRLKVIEAELAGVDSDISAFKSEQMIPDVEAAASMYMQQSTVINQQMQDLSNQLYMARYIKSTLGNSGNQPLPANMGISNAAIENSIAAYNSKLIERNNLADNSGENNVLVKDMDKALATMRGAISQAIDNEILNLNTQYGNLQAQSRQNTARIAANPNQAKQLLSVERQQSVKQSLYLYLLQKREENELSQAFTAYNTRIIKLPVSGSSPVAPKKMQIMLIAFLLGLLIPLGVIYLMMVADTKVRSKNDVKNLSLPYLGEIPLASKKKTLFNRFKRTAVADNTVVVRAGSRNVTNEAFRVMRTNLEFMTKEAGSNVLAFTSFNPGSGKSFLSMNLGVCLAIKGNRVLLIDGDLRHGSLSAFVGSPEKGLSDFLAKKTDDISGIIIHHQEYGSLDVIPIGTVPPNPAELVADPLFGQMVSSLKRKYDYVIIDCPPIDIVTDARIINQYVDRTIFVVRAGLLDKAQLPELENLYKGGDYNNLCFVLNGTTKESGYYGHYGHYGYYGGKSRSYYGSDSDDDNLAKA